MNAFKDDNRIRLMLIMAVGAVALTVRPPASWTAVAITTLVGIAGMVTPVAPAGKVVVARRWWVIVLMVGMAPFAAVRAAGSILSLTPFFLPAVAANVVAAVAEEAFFRRLGYGALARWGAGVAVLGTAAAFAIVHVPTYGWAVLPTDLAAGVILGWQRWASGGWGAPALTHVFANLLQMG